MSQEESIKAIMYNQHLCGFKSHDSKALNRDALKQMAACGGKA